MNEPVPASADDNQMTIRELSACTGRLLMFAQVLADLHSRVMDVNGSPTVLVDPKTLMELSDAILKIAERLSTLVPDDPIYPRGVDETNG